MTGLYLFSNNIYDLVDVLDESDFVFEFIESANDAYVLLPEFVCDFDWLETELVKYLTNVGVEFDYIIKRKFDNE